DDTVARYEEEHRCAERARTEHARFRDVLTRTTDGVRVTLYANVGVASYLTEFPFIVRDEFPTLPEQVSIYSKAYELFPGGPIYFRILDLGGDKFVAG